MVDNVRDSEGVELITVNMSREITPLQDLKSLIELFMVFRRVKADLYIHSPLKLDSSRW